MLYNYYFTQKTLYAKKILFLFSKLQFLNLVSYIINRKELKVINIIYQQIFNYLLF